MAPAPPYLAALVLGAVAVAWLFPGWALLGGVPPGAPIGADFATHVIGQRYFFAAPWHWPLLVAPGPDAPFGVNIAFTDSIPLAAIIAKLLRPVLPPFDQVITMWQALCWLLQPVAAVFALRSMSERRVWTALCVATIALVQPIFVTRLRHAALCSHFTILLMLGLYARIVRGSRGALVGGCLLVPLCLLVHPYLAAMNAAILAAAPLTLLIRRDRFWRLAGLGVLLSACSVGLLSVALGYDRGFSPGGYGYFSMNLAGPFYPAGSSLVRGLDPAAVDATGGQLDAPSFLGMGLVLLILGLGAVSWRRVTLLARRHGGLTIVCAVLMGLAVSPVVYVFHVQVVRLAVPVGWLEPLRASGRLFWPVTYVLLIGGVAVLLRQHPRRARSLLPLVVALQVADGSGLLLYTRDALRTPVAWQFDAQRMRAMLAGRRLLTVVPVYGCNFARDDLLMQMLWIGSERLIDTNTIYAARSRQRVDCSLARTMPPAPGPGELLVVQPGFASLVAAAPYAGSCRMLSAYTVCMQDVAGLTGLPMLR